MSTAESARIAYVTGPEAVVASRRLLGGGLFFAAAVIAHNADHVRRGVDAVDPDVFLIGTAAITLEVALVVLICQRHRVAALASTVVGFSLAAGYVFVHFLPERPWLSDNLVTAKGIGAWSIAAASIEVVAALTLAIAGLGALSRLGGVGSAVRPYLHQRTLREALLHPLALTFAASQAVTLAISLSQL